MNEIQWLIQNFKHDNISEAYFKARLISIRTRLLLDIQEINSLLEPESTKM